LMVDHALRRAMFILRGYAAITWHRAAERSIHLCANQLLAYWQSWRSGNGGVAGNSPIPFSLTCWARAI
jgi:hypothetical protein